MSQPADQIYEKSIRQYFTSSIFKRGLGLWKAQHVSAIQEVDVGDDVSEYQADVIGSTGNSYEVWICVFNNKIIDADCDCEYHYACKHACALALALLEQKRSQPRAHDTQQLARWLTELKQLNSPTQVGALSADWFVFYLLKIADDAPFRLMPVLRYKKKNNDWGRMEFFSEHRHHQGQINSRDRSIFSALRALRVRLDICHGVRGSSYELQGKLGHHVLTEALASGQLLDAESLNPVASADACALNWDWEPADAGQRLVPRLDLAEPAPWLILPTDPPLYGVILGEYLLALGAISSNLSLDMLRLLLNMPSIPQENFAATCLQLANVIEGDQIPLPESLSLPTRIDSCQPKLRLCGIATPAHGILPGLALSACYGPLEFPLLYKDMEARQAKPDEEVFIEQDGAYFQVTRRYGAEYALKSQLRALDFSAHDFAGDIGEFWIPPEVDPVRYLQAWHKNLPKLQQLAQQQDWLIEVDTSYYDKRSGITMDAEASNYANGWFDFDMRLAIAGHAVNTAELVSQWLAAGTPSLLALRNEQQQWDMVDMSPLQPLLSLLLELYGEPKRPALQRLPAFKILELDALDEQQIKTPAPLKKLRSALKGFAGIETVAPDKKLTAELRDYQQQGLSWLMFLRRYGFGGILADDMGLGKTLQTLAFIQKLKATRKLTRGALIVAPTSLIWNWLSEAKKFTPNLSCLMLHGAERKTRFDEIPGHDLIITTYGLIARDNELYQAYHFDLAVLDEAQNIKNAQAKSTHSVKQLNADMRLCLTGTPLENHLGELWSLMDFALPGLLGTQEHFRKNIRQPIEQGNGEAERQQLSKRLAPFMLRRTKSQVVQELPDKTEILQSLEFERDQKSLYESIRVSMEKRVRDLIKQKGVARSHIEFLDALLKLRQACIDPRLVKLAQAKKSISSTKMTWLQETLPELVEEGRKILIFSQFTEMLELIEQMLQGLKIASVKLTGRTRKRQEVIEQFQNTAVPVFLISLKAGGAGLNLTAADTVIHVDPWWNPAVENQATDRAYRIGQDKPVFVYKLVVSGTLEEKIQQLQQQKQSLADSLFDATQKAGIPTAGEELLALFKA